MQIHMGIIKDVDQTFPGADTKLWIMCCLNLFIIMIIKECKFLVVVGFNNDPYKTEDWSDNLESRMIIEKHNLTRDKVSDALYGSGTDRTVYKHDQEIKWSTWDYKNFTNVLSWITKAP